MKISIIFRHLDPFFVIFFDCNEFVFHHRATLFGCFMHIGLCHHQIFSRNGTFQSANSFLEN